MNLAQGKKIKSGLDDGTTNTKHQRKTKCVKNAQKDMDSVQDTSAADVAPTIRPGEKMSDFSARVDASLPLSGLVTKTVKEGKDPLGFKVRRTKKERQMHKLYDEWREEDKKIKEKRQEVMDEEEERQLDEDLANGSWKDWTKDYSHDIEGASGDKTKRKKKKKGKKRKAVQEDQWNSSNKHHVEPRRGLHDIADAPPNLRSGPGNKIKVRNDAAGS